LLEGPLSHAAAQYYALADPGSVRRPR
jgi:hypothetical protein